MRAKENKMRTHSEPEGIVVVLTARSGAGLHATRITTAGVPSADDVMRPGKRFAHYLTEVSRDYRPRLAETCRMGQQS